MIGFYSFALLLITQSLTLTFHSSETMSPFTEVACRDKRESLALKVVTLFSDVKDARLAVSPLRELREPQVLLIDQLRRLLSTSL